MKLRRATRACDGAGLISAAGLAHSASPMNVGIEWIVDAGGCDPDRLRDLATLEALLEEIVGDLALVVVEPPTWHVFPGEGGVTGLVLLSESHIAFHTFPEHGIATFNLYCCRERPNWAWAARLRALLEAEQVTVRSVARGVNSSIASVEAHAT
jgi:S-adenosylmethionine decarboxylase